MCSQRRGILGPFLETANYSLSSDGKHLFRSHFLRSSQSLISVPLRPWKLECPRRLFHSRADAAASRAPVWSDFWVPSSPS